MKTEGAKTAPGVATVGVYVHVPFCERVCPYCDFPVVAARTLGAEREDRYVEALLRELAARRGAFPGASLASVYLGGGTPSLLRPGSVARVVGAVRGAFPEADGEPEVTLEVNPSTVERERLPAFRAAGVNRLSIGIQSFDDAVLKALGRAHRADEGRETLRAARRAGFDNVSLDLIFAAPGQGEAGLAADLDEALAFELPHVSAYALTIEAGTPFALAARRGQLDLPDDDVAAARTEQVWGALEAAGLAQYEISSFARPGSEAVHNRRYWQRRPVLGLGMGAWSHEPPGSGAPHGLRRANVRALGAYLEACEAGRSPAEEPPEVLSHAAARLEATFLGLRTREGLSAAAFEAEFGAPPRALYPEIAPLCDAGLLAEDARGDLRLSPRGRLLADAVLGRLVRGV